LALDANLAEIVEVIPGVLPGLSKQNFGLAMRENGLLTTSWHQETPQSLENGELVFSILLKAKSDVDLEEMMELGRRYVRAEAYTAAAGLLDIDFNFTTVKGTQELVLLQNRPNPFKNQTLIGFNLPESTSATLTIFDVTGRVVLQTNENYKKGYHEVMIDHVDLGLKGLLYYRLETSKGSMTKRMLAH